MLFLLVAIKCEYALEAPDRFVDNDSSHPVPPCVTHPFVYESQEKNLVMPRQNVKWPREEGRCLSKSSRATEEAHPKNGNKSVSSAKHASRTSFLKLRSRNACTLFSTQRCYLPLLSSEYCKSTRLWINTRILCVTIQSESNRSLNQ